MSRNRFFANLCYIWVFQCLGSTIRTRLRSIMFGNCDCHKMVCSPSTKPDSRCWCRVLQIWVSSPIAPSNNELLGWFTNTHCGDLDTLNNFITVVIVERQLLVFKLTHPRSWKCLLDLVEVFVFGTLIFIINKNLCLPKIRPLFQIQSQV